MNWDAIGAIAEMLAAIATVATLVYLAVQIRQNSSLVRGSSAVSYREGLNSFNGILAQNRECAEIWDKGLEEPAALSSTDQRQFESLLNMLLVYLQQAEELETAGMLSSELAYTRDVQIDWLVSQPGFRTLLADRVDFYPPRFRERVEEAIRRQS